MSPHKSLFFFISVLLVGSFVMGCSNSPQSAQKKIDKIARDMQAELPKMLDPDTKLVSVYANTMELVSEYELVNYDPAAPGNDVIKHRIELYLTKQVCPGIKKELLGKGISSRYIYHGNNGQTIGEWLIAPGDC